MSDTAGKGAATICLSAGAVAVYTSAHSQKKNALLISAAVSTL